MIEMHKYKKINERYEINLICPKCGIKMDLLKKTELGNLYKCSSCGREQEVR